MHPTPWRETTPWRKTAPWRKTTQPLLPARIEETAPAPDGCYNLYPTHELGAGEIEGGFDALAQRLASAGQATIDGMPGVLWADLRERLDAALQALGVYAHWVDVAAALQPPAAIDALLAPFLGGDDPIFGTRFSGELADFFDVNALRSLQPDPHAALTILYGCGAALGGWPGTLVYVDAPKNEIQFRQRAGSVTCLGAAHPLQPRPAYKRSYFAACGADRRRKQLL